MSDIDRHLDRLLRAAAQAPRPEPGELPTIPFTTQARALAQWRATRSAARDSGILRTWRAGLATAFATAFLAVGVSFAMSRDIDAEVNDPYLAADPGVTVAMSTGWLP